MSNLTVYYNSKGESGNIFWILRAICDECKCNGIRPNVFKEMQEQVLLSNSYEAALSVIRKYVNLIDTASPDVPPDTGTTEAEFHRADETAAAFTEITVGKQDRAAFVHNLGILLSQTREGIVGCELDENDIVSVHFKHGVRRINVECDSYMAIIRDVANRI